MNLKHWATAPCRGNGISIPIYGIMNLKQIGGISDDNVDKNLNSHLWDYEPETILLWRPENVYMNLNSHLWDYEPETEKNADLAGLIY